MKKWQWELRKALKRWKLAILVTSEPVTLESLNQAAAEKGIRNVLLITFHHLTPLSPREILKDRIMAALSNSEKPCSGGGIAGIAVMSQELLDHYRSWTGGWFIELFEDHTRIINVKE